MSTPTKTAAKAAPLHRVRNSRIHGRGVFAARDIRKGTRIIEYLGERVSHRMADLRYSDKAADDNHTFLFTVNSRTVIDGGVGGSDARWINHGCAPNCESVIEKGRVFVEAVRTIRKGEELTYDYMIERDPYDPPGIDEVFACRCGALTCRGTMLLPHAETGRKPRTKLATRRKKAAAEKSAGKTAKKAVKKATRKKASKKKAVKKAAKKRAPARKK